MNSPRIRSLWLTAVLSILSGCAWGAIAYGMGHKAFGPRIWWGVLAAPAIGLAAGALSPLFDKRSTAARIGLALLSLYVMAALFGLACGVGKLASFSPPAPGLHQPEIRLLPLPTLVGGITLAWWGLTFTGYVLVLWPLAFANHAVVLKAWRSTRRQGAA